MSFAERSKEWLGAQQPPSPMFVGSATPVAETAQRVPIESQASIGLLLEAILDELKRVNSAPRESSSVSSCEVKFLANGTPQPTIKAYAGSEVPVDAAIEAYGRTFLMAQQAVAEGWEQALDVLQAERRPKP